MEEAVAEARADEAAVIEGSTASFKESNLVADLANPEQKALAQLKELAEAESKAEEKAVEVEGKVDEEAGGGGAAAVGAAAAARTTRSSRRGCARAELGAAVRAGGAQRACEHCVEHLDAASAAQKEAVVASAAAAKEATLAAFAEASAAANEAGCREHKRLQKEQQFQQMPKVAAAVVRVVVVADGAAVEVAGTAVVEDAEAIEVALGSADARDREEKERRAVEDLTSALSEASGKAEESRNRETEVFVKNLESEISVLKGKLEKKIKLINELNDAAYGDLAHWASTDEDNPEKAALATNENGPEWVLDSGASKHVASKSCVLSLTISILLLTRALYKRLMAQNSLS